MRTFTNVSFGLILSLATAGIGCMTNRPSPVASTEGEKIEYQASVLKEKADLIKKGEGLVADGRAMVARGNALKDQGNALEGQNIVIEGEAKIRQGENYLAQADAIMLPRTDTPVVRERPRTDLPPSARVPEE